MNRIVRRSLALPILVGLGWVTYGRMVAQTPRNVAVQASPDSRALEINRGAAALSQSLEKLHTRASMLMVTAHPDDEDGGMLAYESRGQGARVTLLTLNRGEAGQNAMSNDYFDALGLVRTQELLAADRYYGVQQYFTTVIDYGFSKTKEQAFQKWGHERVLGDAVRVVRMTHPLVVTSVFVGGASDGHGNHEVAGQMAQEVYKDAGDPTKFPDQLKAGLKPWTPLKVYARVPVNAITPKGIFDYATGKYVPGRIYDYVNDKWMEGTPSIEVEIPEGTYNPLLGGSYIQVSRQGLGMQKTQNGGPSVPDPGPSQTPYHLYGSRVATPGTSGGRESSIFEGIDTSLMGIATLAPSAERANLRTSLSRINQLVEQAILQFSAAKPEKIAPILAQGLSATQALMAKVKASSMPAQAKDDVSYELQVKQVQFNDALLEALGLSLNARVAPPRSASPGRGFGGAQPSFQIAIPGQRFSVEVHLANSGSLPVELSDVSVQGPKGEGWQIQMSRPAGAGAAAQLAPGKASVARFNVQVPDKAGYTRPYFSRPSTEQAYYNIEEPQYIDLPNAPYPLAAWATFQYQGVALKLGQVVQTAQREVGPGTVETPLVIEPAISVLLDAKAGIVPLGSRTFNLGLTVHSNVKGPAEGTVSLKLPEGWIATPAEATFKAAHDGEDQPVAFEVHPSQLAPQQYHITAVATYNGQTFEEGYQVTGYQGVRPYYLFRPAMYTTTGVDVKVAPSLNVGYVVGAGDDVPQALQDLGIHVHFLTDQDLASGNLMQYSAIVLGVRAYGARPGLATYNGRLMQYVRDGGALVVQYQTSEFDQNYGPYPLTLGRSPEKVMDEHSAVQILEPDNPVMSWPNKITEADFQNWIEERGHSFMSSWAPQYQALVEMHDPDQDPQKGGLLYARYGKGVWVYAGLAFYRQFTEGVPGAYRIFANLISVGQAPAAQ